MFQAYGLYTHIRANRIKTVLLLVGFVVLLQIVLSSVFVVLQALFIGGAFNDMMRAAQDVLRHWHIALIAAGLWFTVAYFLHQKLINAAVGAVSLDRSDEPELYNALETLCISRGLTTPRLQIIETSALNAFASGISDKSYTVTVTRGLIDTLAPDEMEAVLAHELTHIRNHDTQLMVIATIFAGIFAFVGDMFIRGWDFPYGFSPIGKPNPHDNWRTSDGWQEPAPVERPESGGFSYRPGKGKGGSGGAILAIIVAVAIILISWGISVLIRLALSRTREYLADAGAVELTKNPEALVRALTKISQRSEFDVPSRMEAFFIENPIRSRLSGLFSTHPPIEDRIEALRVFGGARLGDASPPAPAA
jgi:heat shock protein HtpX